MGLFLLLIFSYLVGAIPTGIIMTKITGGEDLRTVGSGNIGATNVYRTAGRKMGLVTLAGDSLKGIIPALIALVSGFQGAELGMVGLMALLGHCYPAYINFKGGKGVATAFGVFLVISPGSILLALSLFLVVLGRWRYISLASISAAAALPYLVLLVEQQMMLFFVTFCMAALVIYRHKENIERLLAKKENKFSL
ncbi:acyl-phosphate glycerol-3-phosphate acyltransferase [Malonomonas rubra DSM 5091]|uniref:Glycerol-3-phosphate acyltransferase n=1 Tax=Malonomonas rubra DSM 5091 TaxID=1122189 RepID=A0A1M6HN79_MALRU|nr:glycerol-3-phosphate 1-O-acyltransferase PlsY [Malonomonas rubra]SHJ23566.1 acyl-phosphate glycerol-3-phosphate acyltransferase [Malonomonas rubra DSM 5091]